MTEQDNSSPFRPGKVLVGRYEVGALLGEGGMAHVYEGRHLRLDQRVAIKVLRRELWKDAVVVARFEREGRALSKMSSRNVVRVIDVDTAEGGAAFMVMERLDGVALDEEIHARGPLPVGEAVSYIMQACTGLAEAHRNGVIHRDVKPSNVFLANDGRERVVKVIDFGISKNAGDEASSLTKAESLMGTPLYMAPEQLRSTRDVDARADVWALGATLYHALCGTPPFQGSSMSVAVAITTEAPTPIDEKRPDVPPELAKIIARSLERHVDERFQSVQQLAAALAPYSSIRRSIPTQRVNVSASVRPEAPTQLAAAAPTTETSVESSARTATEHSKKPFALLALTLVAIAGAVVFFALRNSSGPSPAAAASPFVIVSAPSSTAAPTLVATSSIAPAVSLAPVPEIAPASSSAVPSARTPLPLAVSTPRSSSTASSPRPGTATPPPPPTAPIFFPQ